MKKKLWITLALALLLGNAAQAQRKYNALRETDPAFFKTEQAKAIGDQVIAYQRITGGWPKNIDMAKTMSQEELENVLAEKSRQDDSTTDNNATSMQMNYLARLYQATHLKKYKDAFCKGVEYLLSGQYANGGWPQFWPKMRDYQIHITFNDNAMTNTMRLLRDVYLKKSPFNGDLTSKKLQKKASAAFNKGVDCILKCQIIKDVEPTVWCQQHDRENFSPAPARAFELASYCSAESASIVELLMDIPNPSEEVKRSIRGAMKWFDTYKLTGVRLTRDIDPTTGLRNTKLVKDPKATEPLWARFYDLENCSPFVCDRDGIPRKHLEEIGSERRNGYGWYNNSPAALYPRYENWAKKYDANNKLDIRLNGNNLP